MTQDLMLYDKMQLSIAACYSIDDCREIAAKSDAMAAYYRQIKDDTSVIQFLRIKIRAWRRIGELILNSVDKSKYVYIATIARPDLIGRINYAELQRLTSEVLKSQIALSDSEFRNAAKLAEVPADLFEKAVDKCWSISALLRTFEAIQKREWEQSPEGIALFAEIKATHERREVQRLKNQEEKRAETRALIDDCQERRIREDREKEALFEAQKEAFREVGVTLNRKDRAEMHQIVFLIKRSIYEVLRKAHFDHRMTMQKILREGLLMWLKAHDYEIPPDGLPSNQKTSINLEELEEV